MKVPTLPSYYGIVGSMVTTISLDNEEESVV
jgi:hypothetical protein